MAESSFCSNHDLFANTGIQYIDFKLTPEEADFIDLADIAREDCWTHDEGSSFIYRRFKRPHDDPYARFIIAVDTTTGPVEEGHIAEDEKTLDRSFMHVVLPCKKAGQNIGTGTAIPDELEIGAFRVLPDTGGAGEPIDVALILDLGNCRTNGLLIELRPRSERFENIARPFRLREHMDPTRAEEVFDTTIVWSPNLFPAHRLTKIEERSRNIERHLYLPKKLRPAPQVEKWHETVEVETKLFRDLSLVRLGREASSLRRQFPPERDTLSGMSSPKRYLWADEREDRFWQFMRPGEKIPGKVSGKLLGYIYPDDSDWETAEDGKLIPPTKTSKGEKPQTAPDKPSYPRRIMMTLTLFEIFTQAYQQINSVGYREGLDYGRKRRLTDIVITFSSGMSVAMRERYVKQAEKATEIMKEELPGIKEKPRLHFKWDEGTSVQLAYIYGELRAMEMSARSWLKLVGRRNPKKKLEEVRIATIDIGGGSTDFVISDYSNIPDSRAGCLQGKLRYVDGLSRAGDDLARSVIERLIIPQLSCQLGIPVGIFKNLLGTLAPGQEELRRLRAQWVCDLWTPAARKILEIAENFRESETEKSGFRMADICPAQQRLRELRSELEKACKKPVQDPAQVRIIFEPQTFTDIVDNTLGPVLSYAAKTIARFDCDITILAGRVSSLPRIRQLTELYLPTTTSRIVALRHYRTGEWYPYQVDGRPGEIDDPKTAVVVGAAVAFLSESRYGLRDFQLKLDIDSFARETSYYWGIASPVSQKIRKEDVVFKPRRIEKRGEKKPLRLIGTETSIARRINSSEDSSANPVYAVLVKQEKDVSRLDLRVWLERKTDGEEEKLYIADAEGNVGEKSAVPGENIFLKNKTIFEDLYYLDTGVFPYIEGSA